MASGKPIRYVRPHQPLSDWLKQLYARRETLWFFVWRDLKVQYGKPIFGLLWSVFQPLVYFGIILLVMQVSGREGTGTDLPFPVYLICGLAIWNFTTASILGAINSVQANAGIISKSNFPRFYLILAPMMRNSVDLVIVLLICFGMAIYYKLPIQLETLTFLPTLIFLSWITTLGWAGIAASASIWNRHVRHAIPVVLYALIFVLPVFYSIHEIGNPTIKWVYQLNPIAGSMDYLRASFGDFVPSATHLIFWVLQSILWLMIGVLAIRKTERSIADKL